MFEQRKKNLAYRFADFFEGKMIMFMAQLSVDHIFRRTVFRPKNGKHQLLSLSLKLYLFGPFIIHKCKYYRKDHQYPSCLIRQQAPAPQTCVLMTHSAFYNLKYLTFSFRHNKQPSSRLEQWNHFWPDWPTGTLRVEFRRF